MEDLYAQSRTLRRKFEELIDDCSQDLWKYCLALTRSPWDAEDLSQDTLLKGFAQLNYLYQVVNPKAYLLRVASNLWIDRHRTAFREEVRDMETCSNFATEKLRTCCL